MARNEGPRDLLGMNRQRRRPSVVEQQREAFRRPPPPPRRPPPRRSDVVERQREAFGVAPRREPNMAFLNAAAETQRERERRTIPVQTESDINIQIKGLLNVIQKNPSVDINYLRTQFSKDVQAGKVDPAFADLVKRTVPSVVYDPIGTKRKLRKQFQEAQNISKAPYFFHAAYEGTGIPPESIEELRRTLSDASSDAELERLVDSVLLSELQTTYPQAVNEWITNLDKNTYRDIMAWSWTYDFLDSHPDTVTPPQQIKNAVVMETEQQLARNAENLQFKGQGAEDVLRIATEYSLDPTDEDLIRYLPEVYNDLRFVIDTKQQSKKFFGGVPILGGAEDIVKPVIREVASKIPGQVMDAATWLSDRTQEIAAKTFVQAIDKSPWSEPKAIIRNWDRYPPEVRSALEDTFYLWGTAYNTELNSEAEQAELVNELAAGPPPKAIFQGEFEPMDTTYTSEEYEEWAESVIANHSNAAAKLNMFAGSLIFDPLNLVGIGLLKTIPKGAAGLNNAIKFYEAGQKTGIYKIPGGPVIARFLDGRTANVVKNYDVATPAQGLEWWRNINKAIPTIKFPVPMTNKFIHIPKTTLTKITSGPRISQAQYRIYYLTGHVNHVLDAFGNNIDDGMRFLKEVSEAGARRVANEATDVAAAMTQWNDEITTLLAKNNIKSTRYVAAITNAFAENPELLTNIEKRLSTRKVRTPHTGVGNQEYNYFRFKNTVAYEAGYAEGDRLLRTTELKGLFKNADDLQLAVQGTMRTVLNKLYLAGPRVWIRNYANDRFRAVLEGYGMLPSLEKSAKWFYDVGQVVPVQTKLGPLEQSVKAANRGIKMLEPGKDMFKKEKGFRRFWNFLTTGGDQAASQEATGRTALTAKSAQEYARAFNSVRANEFTATLKKGVDLGMIDADDFDVISKEVQKIMSVSDNPGALEGLINAVKKGRLELRPDLSDVAGVSVPSFLEKGLLEGLDRAARKGKGKDFLSQYLGKPTYEVVDGQVRVFYRDMDARGSLRNAMYKASQRMGVEMQQDIDDFTEFFVREMDYWVDAGLTSDDALARALGSYGERLRTVQFLRMTNKSIGLVDKGARVKLDKELTKLIQETLETETKIIQNTLPVTDDFKVGGKIHNRMNLWSIAAQRYRKMQMEEATKWGVNADMGLMGHEIRGGLGFATELGADEWVTGLDGLAAWHGPAEWYLRRVFKNGGGTGAIKYSRENARLGAKRDTLIKELEALREARKGDMADAVHFGMNEADRVFMNYSMQGDLDFMMKWFFPWQFWATRAWPRYMSILARNPYFLSHYQKMEEQLEADNEASLFRLKNKIPLPFAGEVLDQGILYFDPIRLFIPQDFMNAIIFEEQKETTLGQIRFALQKGGFGVNPLFDLGRSLTGVGTSGRFDREMGLPPAVNLANRFISAGLKMAGVSDRQSLRITLADTRRIGQELDYMLANGEITEKEYYTAVKEWNEQFPETGELADSFRNPVISSPVLNTAWNKVMTRSTLEESLSYLTGLAVSFDHPGREKTFQLRQENGEIIQSAFKALTLGDSSKIQELMGNPEYRYLLSPQAEDVNEQEANRWLARNEYFEYINFIDDSLDRKLATLSPFDPEVSALKGLNRAEHNKKLRQVTEKYDISENDLIGSMSVAADIARINQKLLEGAITPQESGTAINHFTIRAIARLSSVDPELFKDQDGVFNASAYHETTQRLADSIPDNFKNDVDKWKKRDATVEEAIRQAWEELYIHKVFEGIHDLSSILDKEERAYAIDNWKRQAQMPDVPTMVEYINQNYPQLPKNQVLEEVVNNYLPNFEAYSILDTESQILRLQRNNEPFRSPNERLVNRKNIDEFMAAWDEFTVWKYAKENDLPRTGLWTELVEKYWGNGVDTAAKIRELTEVDSQIDNIFRVTNPQTDAEIDYIVDNNKELSRLYERKRQLEEEIVIDNKRNNFYNSRSSNVYTSYTKSNSRYGDDEGGLVSANMSASDVAVVLASARPEWIASIGSAMANGTPLDPQTASELFAIFERNNMGFNSFEDWLITLFETWDSYGRPGQEFVNVMLRQAASQLSPGETVGTIEEQPPQKMVQANG